MVVSQRFTVMQSEESFGQGQYTYPLQFVVPNGLPGTLIHKVKGVTARLQYNMYAEIYSANDGVGRAWSPIVMMQTLRKEGTVGLAGTCQSHMMVNCKEGGQIKLQASFDKDYATADDTCRVNCQLDLGAVPNGKIKKI